MRRDVHRQSLKFLISTPEYQQQARGQWERQLSLTEGIISPQSFVQSKDLNVASYDQAKSNSEYNGCGPAAGSMILDYWDINGYTNLQDDADRATGVNLMNHLFGDMGTGPTGTSTTGWISGIKTHANSHSGYNFNSWTRYWDSTIRGTFWSELKNEINAGRPFGMWFPLNYQPYSAHIVPCRGFFEDEYCQKYHVNTRGVENSP